MNTAQRMGYGKTERLLIVNADDFGLCRSVNEGVAELLLGHQISSATIMMNCSWSADAVSFIHETVPDADIGIHWTLTSEWSRYRWGSLSRSRGTTTLTDHLGWFPASVVEIEQRADPEEVRVELISQIEAALKAGVTLTHADNHMGSLYGFYSGKDLLPIAFDVCARYGLPFRLPRRLISIGGRTIPVELQERAKVRARQAEDRGIVLPDYVTGPEYRLSDGDTYDSVKTEGIGLLRQLLPGITEWITHPSHVTDELRAFHGHSEKRGMELKFWKDEDVRAVLTEEQIRLIGWKELQSFQASLAT
ncbi:polysaccharide deacetylase family protein [Cohnella sp.]|uniref:polysaccharide deacetylase family protein n=1 Tax=Cohnella sp. TaxID=1883426 RepID=UPI003564C7CE